ncbi:hypothetical protein [Nesterenkonia sp. K-15-9-6]|uniref:hypothetical protein n=1 Tax=Nesterenkonia sp. K-15-9-6 TaxID=3093918 RepID=UPI0040444780
MAIETRTGQQRYRQHKVWETLQLKLDALNAARFDGVEVEQWRIDVVDWLKEAQKSKTNNQPTLYLSALDDLQEQLNNLEVDQSKFKQYVGLNNRTSASGQPRIKQLERALRGLPLPPPKNLSQSYAEQLDREMKARQEKLAELNSEIDETKAALQSNREEIGQRTQELADLSTEIEAQQKLIKKVSEDAQGTIDKDWRQALTQWKAERDHADEQANADAAQHLGALASAAEHGRVLLDQAVGNFSATDWAEKSTQERKTATLLRNISFGTFVVGILFAAYITYQAIANEFDMSIGDALLRGTILVVVAAAGALVLRESNSHRREANAAQDMATSLVTLAPFYENTDGPIRLAARQQLGDALLVKNVLSRFAHRDAARHVGNAGPLKAEQIAEQVIEALKLQKPESVQDQRPETQ